MSLLHETRLTLDQAAVQASATRRTVERWVTEGFAGRVLESVLIGRHRFTSAEALNRFIAATNRTAVAG